MNINKNNYEAYFLDYHEGNLTPQQVADLLLFVEQHEELKDEFENFESVRLEDLSNVSFEGKSSLKKEITIKNKEDYFIRSVENTLNNTEIKLVENFVKQHPQYLTELELYHKTKLSADASIIFENKESLKHIPFAVDDLIIASVEGLLTKNETTLLNKQLSVDAEMKYNLLLYKQTKLVADKTIVFENKEALKQKERKTIPIYYYFAAAASIALILGLIFIFNNNTIGEQNLADKSAAKKVQQKENKINTNVILQQEETINKISKSPIQTASVARVKKQAANPEQKNKTPETATIIKEPLVNEIAENKVESKKENTTENFPIANKQQTTGNDQQTLAKMDKQPSKKTGNEYLSIRELAAEKIKEKTLDDNSFMVQKKNGRYKRFSGWDVAQIITRGISKITGRDVEVKPTYNDEGDVTAYALGGGFQVTRGR